MVRPISSTTEPILVLKISISLSHFSTYETLIFIVRWSILMKSYLTLVLANPNLGLDLTPRDRIRFG